MINIKKVRAYIIFFLVFITILNPFFSNTSDAEDDSFLETQQKIMKISDDEKKILQELFVIAQEMQAMEKEEEKLTQDIKSTKHKIEVIEQKISSEETNYEKKLNALEQVLKNYQRRGPGSYLEIILSSESLTMLLRRINTLKDITRGTDKLLEEIEASKKNMSFEKTKLTENLVLIEEKQHELKEALNSKLQFKNSMEDYLVSLKEERQYYEEYLGDIEKMWEKLKPLLSNVTKAFSSIIQEDNLSLDMINVKFSFLGIKGSIDEKTFNNIASKDPMLSQIEFSFEPGSMIMKFPKENLALSGNLVVADKSTLKFEVKKGSFYDMPLEQSSIEELFQEGYLTLNLEPLLGENTLSSVVIEKENIILTIKPKLF